MERSRKGREKKTHTDKASAAAQDEQSVDSANLNIFLGLLPVNQREKKMQSITINQSTPLSRSLVGKKSIKGVQHRSRTVLSNVRSKAAGIAKEIDEGNADYSIHIQN